jgi:hypothetical protein
MGKIYDCAHYKKKYGVDHVHFVEDVTQFFFSILLFSFITIVFF